jgi:Single-strand binding protein family
MRATESRAAAGASASCVWQSRACPGGETGYVNVVAHGRRAEAAARLLANRWLVAVAGRLSYRAWETDDGSKRYGYERQRRGREAGRWPATAHGLRWARSGVAASLRRVSTSDPAGATRGRRRSTADLAWRSLSQTSDWTRLTGGLAAVKFKMARSLRGEHLPLRAYGLGSEYQPASRGTGRTIRRLFPP